MSYSTFGNNDEINDNSLNYSTNDVRIKLFGKEPIANNQTDNAGYGVNITSVGFNSSKTEKPMSVISTSATSMTANSEITEFRIGTAHKKNGASTSTISDRLILTGGKVSNNNNNQLILNNPYGGDSDEDRKSAFIFRGLRSTNNIIGTSTAAGANTITLAEGSSAVNDFYNGNKIKITSGDGNGEVAIITDYVGATRVATVHKNWVTAPTASNYKIQTYSNLAEIVVSHNGTDADDKGKVNFNVNNGDVNDSLTNVLTLDGTGLTVRGNFSATGTTNTNTTTKDTLMKLGQDSTVTTHDLGLILTRGNDGGSTNIGNKGIIWDQSLNRFALIACNEESGSTYGDVTINNYESLDTAGISHPSAVLTLNGSTGVNIQENDTNIISIDTDRNITTTNTVQINLDCSGALSLNSSDGVINVGNDAVAQAINIGSGASARTITIGNDTSTKVDVNALAIELDSAGTVVTDSVTTTSITSGTTMTLRSGGILAIDTVGTHAINFGTEAAAKTITIGNDASAKVDVNALDIELDAGANGITLNSAGAIDITTSASDSNITIDPHGSGTLALGSSDNTAVTVDALAITLTSVNALTLTDGTATLDLGGTGATSLSGATTVDLDCSGALSLNSSGGVINVGDDAVTQAINIGSGASARTITIGNDISTKVDVNALAIELDSKQVTHLLSTTGVATASSLTWRPFHIPAASLTTTGSTNVTTSTGLNLVEIAAPTIIDDGSSFTVTNSATVYIGGAPSDGGGGGTITITNPYSLWVDSGDSRFDAPIHLDRLGGAPSTTTDRLYNQDGTLKFNGSDVGGGGASSLNALTDVIGHSSDTTNFLRSLLIETDGNTPSMQSLTEAIDNIGIGNNVFANLTTGDQNVGIGNFVLDALIGGSNNACFGHASGSAINTGTQNTCIGSQAGDSLVDGTNNTVIGYNAAASANDATNEVTLGDANVTTLRCGATTIASLSDRRDKTDIIESEYGLNFIEKLKPVQFTWDRRVLNKSDENNVHNGKKRIGFIAQDLQDAMPNNENDILDLVNDVNPERIEAKYGNLIPILVKSIQELQNKVNMLEKTIENFK